MSEAPDINAVLEDEIKADVEEKELSAIEKEAMEEGWSPLDKFEGDPDKWVSAREFVRYGKLQKTMNRMKDEFDSRLRDVNKYHEMQKAQAVAELKAQQKQAVRSGDEETYDVIQKRIEQFESAAPSTSKDPVVAAWEEKNAWVNDPNDPRTLEANAFYAGYKQRNPSATEGDALAYVDERLAKLYPDTKKNALRDTPTRSESGGQRPTTNSNKRALDWGDLHPDELKAWKDYGSDMFKGDKKAFLKIAADARKK